jgi:hypothetical protein
MSYDLSRKTFNPLNDYFGVVMQQGRVQLDADWNAMSDQFKRRIQAGDLDTFNGSVVPRQTPDAFLVSGPANAIEIGPGRIYVDGLLAENHTDTLRWDARLEELSGTAKLSGIELGAAPSGPNGTTAYADQPYYPFPPDLPEGETYLVYLDVWLRDVTWLQDSDLVDAAVGIDTTAREQTVWQVKVLEGVGDIDPTVGDLDIPGWLEAIHPSSARLSTDTGDLVDDDNPCLLPPQAGYKGLENQLYRVEVHNGGSLGTATFKWSRDNAVVATRVSAIPSGNEIVVDSLGRDDVLGFHDGDWVEITDDYRDLKGLPGELRRIQLGGGVDSATRRITLEGAVLPTGSNEGEFPVDGDGLTTPERNTRLIRWDQAGAVYEEDETEYRNLDDPGSSGDIEIPAAGTRLFLENGILVDFDLKDVVDEASFDPEFRTGDYWIFAARVNDSSIELLDRAPPAGRHHHFTKLAIVSNTGIDDCRTLWPPEGGDGGCACSVCVTAEGHNNGSATIQQAVDEVIANGGGTVCVGIGEFFIEKPITIHGDSVTLRGSGWQSLLVTRNPGTLINIGDVERTASDITIERLSGLTSVATGLGSAIRIENVIGLTLRDCYLTNSAVERGTSQIVQFLGVAELVAIERCMMVSERGIVGPGQKEEFLYTADFSIRDCVMNCSQYGIDLGGASFYLGQLDISSNQILEADDAGIQLSGSVDEYTAINIAGNLLSNCATGILSGTSTVRILHNDLEAEEKARDDSNAIAFIAGFEPGPYDDIQVIGNRIRDYSNHAITVRTTIGKMLVKQNQVTNIAGAGFVTEGGGSVRYLSLENNQFTDVDGILPELPGQFAAIYIEASARADIANNVLNGAVGSEKATESRSGIVVVSSNSARIAGNNLSAITPPAYTGLGSGIIISSSVGNFEIEGNEISRVPDGEAGAEEKVSDAAWVPIIVEDTGKKDSRIDNTATGRAATSKDGAVETTAARANEATAAAAAAATNAAAYAPVLNTGDWVYAVSATGLVDFGPAKLAYAKASVHRNYVDATTSNIGAVSMRMAHYCGFTDNEVISDYAGLLVYLAADHVGANNNRLITLDDLEIMHVDSHKYVVMGNMTTGRIMALLDGQLTELQDPWKALNIDI